MGIVIFDPLIHNVVALSDQLSLQDVEQKYTADLFGNWLIERGSFLGRTITRLYSVFEHFGWCNSQKNLRTVLKTAQVGLEKLRRFLDGCQEDLLPPVSTFVALSFDESMQRRFRHADRLLSGQTSFPSFEKAQAVVSPIIIQQITRADIPWDVFSALLHQKPLDGPEERKLLQWIGDVKGWGVFISPFLLLSLFEAAAYRCFPEATPQEREGYTFFLAWTLYKAGLSDLSLPELHAPDLNGGELSTPEGQVEVQFGGLLPLQFPSDFCIRAHEVVGHPNLMALSSSSPLLLGMWMYNVKECPSVIPAVRALSHGHRVRYVIVERLVSSLAGRIWESDGCKNAHDVAVLAKMVKIGTIVLRYPRTLQLELDHLFLTSELEIRTLSPLKERVDFFSFSMFETFLRGMCSQDQERIRLLFFGLKLWNHPHALMYRSLLDKFGFQPSDYDIHRELSVFDVDQENFLHVVGWVHALKEHVVKICGQLNNVPEVATLTLQEQTSMVLSAVKRSQEEVGWISCVPQNLTEYVVASIRQRYNGKKDPIAMMASAMK